MEMAYIRRYGLFKKRNVNKASNKWLQYIFFQNIYVKKGTIYLLFVIFNKHVCEILLNRSSSDNVDRFTGCFFYGMDGYQMIYVYYFL